MALTRLPSFTLLNTDNYTFANITITSNVAAANANLGNAVTANYFIGDGSLLTGLPASYSDTNVAAYLPSYAGNISANVITANSFSGNGSALSSIVGANIVGNVANANYANFAGNALTLNGHSDTYFATSTQGSLADSAVQPGDLATVATTGSYADLINTPTLFDGEYASLANKPSLFDGEYVSLANKPALFSGSYVDLTNKPSLFDGEYASLANKPSLFSGSYTDLTSKPTLGTAAATDASAYATAAQGTKADTALQAANLVGYATESYVGNSIANLVASAPAALDTLNELAIALGNDASYSTTITNALANKLSTSNFASTANTWISTQSTSNLSEGTNLYYTADRANTAIDARVTKSFVDNLAVVANISNVSYSVDGANVTGQVGNALVAGTVYTNAQPNITSVGTLTSLTVTGNANVGTLNVSSGTFVTGNGTGGNISGVNEITANFFIGNGSQLTGLPAGYTDTNANSAIDARVTKTFVDNLAVVANIANTAYSITGSNVSGQVANALIAGTVYTNAQPNITSVGTLSTLNVAGNVTLSDVSNLHILGGTANYVLKTDGAGNLSWVAQSAGGGGGGSTTIANLTDVTVSTPANDQVLSYDLANTKWINKNVVTSALNSSYVTRTYTGDGTTAAFTVTSGTSTNSVIVTLSGIVQTPTDDYTISGTSLTFTTAPANGLGIQIREIGIPLASGSNSQLIFNDAGVLGGNAYLTFNKTTGELVTSKIRVANVANVFVGGGIAGQVLTSYGNGSVAWTNAASGGNLYITAPMTMVGDSFTGDGTTANFTLSVAPSSTYYTIVTIGGVVQPRSYYSIANNVITFSTAPPSPAPVEVTTFGGNSSFMGLATEVTNGSQPNITSVGTLSSLSVTGNVTANMFIGDGSLLTNISAPPASTAGTVTTAAQPNITSVGTLTSLSVTGNISGARLTGNHYGNGSTLSSITGANVTGFVANANVANIALSVSASNITGTVNLANYATVANSVAAANITGSIIATTVTTADQPNITSTGTLTSLTVSGNATFSSWITLQQTAEVLTTNTGATGTVAHDMSTSATFYHTSPSANFTANFTNVSTTDSRAIVAALVIVQGSTPYVPTAVQIDGAAQTIKWLGSTAPTGTASKTDVVSFTLMRVSATWSVYGQYSSYG